MLLLVAVLSWLLQSLLLCPTDMRKAERFTRWHLQAIVDAYQVCRAEAHEGDRPLAPRSIEDLEKQLSEYRGGALLTQRLQVPLVDWWGRRLTVVQIDGKCWLRSFGRNGKDDNGDLDDISLQLDPPLSHMNSVGAQDEVDGSEAEKKVRDDAADGGK